MLTNNPARLCGEEFWKGRGRARTQGFLGGAKATSGWLAAVLTALAAVLTALAIVAFILDRDDPAPHVAYASADARRAQARALAHLHPDRSESAIFEQLMARSRYLAPVERSWDLDHLWSFDYATKYERANVDNLLVPALGAYVGEVMVATLGGRWVPRADLDESQVVIGGVAYLPFLRARHELATQQAQIDASMTQFYREAARGRR